MSAREPCSGVSLEDGFGIVVLGVVVKYDLKESNSCL